MKQTYPWNKPDVLSDPNNSTKVGCISHQSSQVWFKICVCNYFEV